MGSVFTIRFGRVGKRDKSLGRKRAWPERRDQFLRCTRWGTWGWEMKVCGEYEKEDNSKEE